MCLGIPITGLPVLKPRFPADNTYVMLANGNPDGWLGAGFVFGLVWFFKGFQIYRKSLLVEDTPVVPIRSTALGRVQISGTAQGERTFPSPVSATACYASKIDIERWATNRNGGHWEHYRTDHSGVPFYLQDATGRVRVDYHGMEFDVPLNCRREIGGIAAAIRGDGANHGSTSPAAMTDEQLLAYAGPGWLGSHRFRFSEYLVQPAVQYDLVGTCAENPTPAGPADHNMIAKENGQMFLISSQTEKQLEQSLSWKSSLHVWGGATLTVASAATLVARHHWF